MTITELKQLLESGEFHHATDKPNNGCWSGLYIYRKAEGVTGFDVAGTFSTYKCVNPDYETAYQMVRHTGVSVGSRGRG
jgi:hypothetical protein